MERRCERMEEFYIIGGDGGDDMLFGGNTGGTDGD